MSVSSVTVIGAGVSGLSTAIRLLERGLEVRVVAREFTPATTSDVPAALWYPYKASPRERVIGWARATFTELARLARDPEAGVCMTPGIEVFPGPVGDPWWQDAVPSWRRARPDELPSGMADGYVFTAPIVETPVYMPWLLDHFRKSGGRIEEREVQSLDDLATPGAVVVNCSGLGARNLAGDAAVFPSRGQLVLVEPLPLGRFVLDEAVAGSICYVVPRRDAIVLGGTVEDGVETAEVDADACAGILERARRLVPELTAARVLGHRAGLRPCRAEVRLEVEELRPGAFVVHNYGHGGAGFSLSWGCADETATRVAELLGDSSRR